MGKITGFLRILGDSTLNLGILPVSSKTLQGFLRIESLGYFHVMLFNHFVGVKQGALGYARTGTGTFCPGSSVIAFSIQLVEQKEPPSTFQNIASGTIVVIPESAFWKTWFDQVSRNFMHVDSMT